MVRATYASRQKLDHWGDYQTHVLLEQIPKWIRDHFFRFYEFIPRHRRHPRPPLRSWRTEDLVNHVQLMNLVSSLEDRLFREQFQHDAPIIPMSNYESCRYVKEGKKCMAYPALHMSTSGP